MFLIFREMKFCSSKTKRLFIFQGGDLINLRKKQENLVLRNFLYFSKKNFPHISRLLLIKQYNKQKSSHIRGLSLINCDMKKNMCSTIMK